MSDKAPPKPTWWKNTYFWIAGILFVVGVVGLIAGEKSIRDPGQVGESALVLIYFAGAAVMAVNGYLSHQQTVQSYLEHQEENPS